MIKISKTIVVCRGILKISEFTKTIIILFKVAESIISFFKISEIAESVILLLYFLGLYFLNWCYLLFLKTKNTQINFYFFWRLRLFLFLRWLYINRVESLINQRKSIWLTKLCDFLRSLSWGILPFFLRWTLLRKWIILWLLWWGNLIKWVISWLYKWWNLNTLKFRQIKLGMLFLKSLVGILRLKLAWLSKRNIIKIKVKLLLI